MRITSIRFFHEIFSEVVRHAHRENLSLSVLLVDVDGVGQINQKMGMSFGDDVLRHIRQVVEATCTHDELAVRFSGDEFLLVCPNHSARTALARAQRLQSELQSLRFTTPTGEKTQVTCCVGVATLDRSMAASDLIDAVLAATNRAKRLGPSSIAQSLEAAA